MRKALFFWELPQLIAGYIFYLLLQKKTIRKIDYKGVHIFMLNGFKGAISLSWFIFVSSLMYDGKIIAHEYGHSLQSLYLGWLYLPLVGLPSMVRSIIWNKYGLDRERYFNAFPEKWADKLGKLYNVKGM